MPTYKIIFDGEERDDLTMKIKEVDDEDICPRLTGKEDKMKKLTSFLLALCFIFSLTACGKTATKPYGTSQNQEQTENSDSESESSNKPKQANEKPKPFNKDVTLTETVMLEEDGVKITATGLSYSNSSVKLELIIENNSGKDLSFVSGSVGYGCNSINGYMVSDGYLNCDVPDGKKATDDISFGYNSLMFYGIDEIADIEIGFDISDDDYNHTCTGPRPLKTSAFDSHDYGKSHYREAIVSPATMSTFEYEMIHFSEESIYDENGIKLLSNGLMVNRNGDTILLLELENTTDETIKITTSDIAVNGLVVRSSTWSGDTINPGKHRIVDVNLSSVLDAEYWDVYGINDLSSISLSLTQLNEDGDDVTDSIPIKVVVPDVKAEYDSTGTEVYNSAGLRIVSKTILEDSAEHSADMYVLLLAENNSDKTLSIDDVYGSLSVNGFMTDYFYHGNELEDGESAVLQIRLRESSLEDNKIVSVSDVEEVEIGLEIKEGREIIDDPVIKISFE